MQREESVMNSFEVFKQLAATQRRIQIAIMHGEERADENRQVLEKMRAAIADESKAIEATRNEAMRISP
jgi:hypothetical protein